MTCRPRCCRYSINAVRTSTGEWFESGPLEVEVSPSAESGRDGLLDQFPHAGALGLGMQVPERASGQSIAGREADLALRDLVASDHPTRWNLDGEHRRRRRIDRPAIAFGLVRQIALPSLDEEVGDVEGALPEFLVEQRQDLGQRLDVAQLAVQQVDEDLTDLELAREEARWRMMRDEAARGMGPQHGIGFDILGVADVGDPATRRLADVVGESVEARFLDLECAPDAFKPETHGFLEVQLHEVGELASQRGLARRKGGQAKLVQIALNATEVLLERRVIGPDRLVDGGRVSCHGRCIYVGASPENTGGRDRSD